MQGGSALPIAETLRHFLREYHRRLLRVGPHSLPTSFNVVESFLSFSERFWAFDLREEREHLLRLYEYINWYTAGSFPDRPEVLIAIIPEGVVHAYNMVGPIDDFAIETRASRIRILGIALVRHSHELSAMIVAGEAPPNPADEEIASRFGEWQPSSGHEGIRPDPSYGIKDRYVPELPGHARVI